MADIATETLNFDRIWALFQENREQLKELAASSRETDRKLKELAESSRETADRLAKETKQIMRELAESSKETDRQMKETDRQMKETAKRMKETDRRIGELGNRFGELAEHLVAPSIKEKFNALGFEFDKCSTNIDIADARDRCSGAEIDILLENGDVAIAIEVKASTRHRDIERHLERMDVLRRWADRHNDKRKFRGAVAGAIMTAEIQSHALSAGFYVIVQSGDTVEISVPADFVPREW
jgi:hypothetical protein